MTEITQTPHIMAMSARKSYHERMQDSTTKEVAGGSNVKQYGLPEGAEELQDLIEHRNMNFAIGNIFKACYRLGQCEHSDKVRDLNKIKWFIERELVRVSDAE